MHKPYVDLHVHTYHSDGSMSPEEIVAEAVSNGVGMISVTDHNTIDGNRLMRKLCQENNIHYIPGVEICTMTNGDYQHILAYGFDDENCDFVDFIKHMRFLLDEMSVKLVELMQSDYPNVSIDDYFAFTHDRKLGGWKMLIYLVEKGITSSMHEGMRFYTDYGVRFDQFGFSTIAATVYRIKQAGGCSVLAHPGETIGSSDIFRFKDELKRIVSYGIDGIECYYPKHTEEVTQACIEICNASDLMITAGSDCHGSFLKARVGEMNITKDKIRLRL